MNTQNINETGDPVYSKNVIEMLTVANEYCLFLEKAEEYPKNDILPFLQKICPLIYLKASLLPEITDINDEAAEHFVREEQWETMLNMLRQKFGEDDYYIWLDLHDKSDPDPIRGSLAEALADLYQDMKDFVLLYQKPRKASMEYAVYECRNLFETHFGFILVNAQKVLHYLIYGKNPENEHKDLFES
jgi:hypothetical protein